MVILDPKTGVRFGMCNKLDDFYREINCSTIDIAYRYVAGKPYDIFVDDEGLLKEDAEEKVSAVRLNNRGEIVPQLVGTLVFANHDSAGNTTDLSVDDTLAISSRIHEVVVVNQKTGERATNYCVFLD